MVFGSFVASPAAFAQMMTEEECMLLTNNDAEQCLPFQGQEAQQIQEAAPPADSQEGQEPEPQGPPVIFAPTAYVDSENQSVSIMWLTNKPATSIVYFSQNQEVPLVSGTRVVGDEELVTFHTMMLPPNLEGGSAYFFRVSSADRNEEGDTVLQPSSFVAPQLTSPTIIAPSATSVTSSTAVIQWLTGADSTGRVMISQSPQVTDSQSVVTLESPYVGTHHQVFVTGLQPNTQYYYLIESENEAGVRERLLQSSTFITTQ